MKTTKQEITDLFQQSLIRSICPQFSNYRFISMLNNHSWLDYSLGCMFGSFIGDSLGAYVEFAKKIDKTIIQQLMKMIPGGTFNLRAGQVTDDSQMSFHLLEALLQIDLNKPLVEQYWDILFNIAEQYVAWKNSKPFDMGITCRNGIQKIQQIIKISKPNKTAQKQDYLKKITKKVAQTNYKSESNGSLMKITPFLFFGTSISYIYTDQQAKKKYKQLIRSQIELIHPNQTIISSSMHWFKVLWKICLRKNDDKDTLKTIYDIAMKSAKQDKNLYQWTTQVQSMYPIDAKVNIGWAKIAWTNGIRILQSLKNSIIQKQEIKLDAKFFKSYISEIIQKGGDTDTNAAIIGGLLGAIVGFKNLPKEYLHKMFSLDFANKQLKRGNDRPDFYEPRRVFAKIYRFLLKLNLDPHVKSPKY